MNATFGEPPRRKEIRHENAQKYAVGEVAPSQLLSVTVSVRSSTCRNISVLVIGLDDWDITIHRNH